jgi:hypothetical protein
MTEGIQNDIRTDDERLRERAVRRLKNQRGPRRENRRSRR